MKIELDYPFNEQFKSGYLLTNKEPRRVVCLVGKDNSKTSVSYARYLLSCHLRRFLTKDEHVDHKDNNKLNDFVDNLQILTNLENNKKSAKGQTLKDFKCSICGKTFQLTARQSHKKEPTCSRKCGGIKSHLTKKGLLS